jgi:transcriptional regulator with XRE-family HTH domain
MSKVKDCPGFETFGADVKEARNARHLARRILAEMVGIESRYLANIENEGTIPSLPVIIQLVRICGLPMERYFNADAMPNRTRNIQMKFWITEDEKRLIDEKMKLLPTQRYGAYLRKMAIDGYIIYADTADIKVFTSELSAIGRNINQIAKRLNAGGPAYQADIAGIRERLDEIWQLQRRILSNQR